MMLLLSLYFGLWYKWLHNALSPMVRKLFVFILIFFISKNMASQKTIIFINPFQAEVPFLYPLKTLENLWVFYVFRGERNGIMAWNGSIHSIKKCFEINFELQVVGISHVTISITTRFHVCDFLENRIIFKTLRKSDKLSKLSC